MTATANSNQQIALVTCSYRPDFERCARLCASMDRHIDAACEQFLVVPERDRQLFAQLATSRRTVVSTQDILPASFTHLPLLKKWWLDPALWPIRGWMMQQLTKLSADALTTRENIIFVDSDIEFIQALQAQRFVDAGALRLHRKPNEKDTGVHLQWHHSSGELLGMAPRYFGSDYVGALASWRRSNLVQLKRHIENVAQRPWYHAVGRRLTISEYTLYGVFVEHVLGIEQSGHFSCSEDICHSLWYGSETERFLAELSQQKSPQAVLVQSNIGMNPEAVEQLMAQVRRQLAAA